VINFIGDSEKLNSISLINKELVSRLDVNHCTLETVNPDLKTLSHTYPILDCKIENWITILPWEFSKVQTNMVEKMNRATGIITPSQFSKDSFERSNIKTPIKVIPNGIRDGLYSIIMKNTLK